MKGIKMLLALVPVFLLALAPLCLTSCKDSGTEKEAGKQQAADIEVPASVEEIAEARGLSPADVEAAVISIRQTIEKLDSVESIESLLGYEGSAAVAYYKAFRTFLKGEWGFATRQFHPPPDPINAMLSLGYTMLFNHVYAFINVVGFDPYCGFFHQPKHGHATLASDLMEEFRIAIVDRYVISLIHNERVHPEDFQQTKEGMRFTKEALDRFLAGYHGRMLQPFQHPTLNEQTTYLRSIELQVRHLARVILGEETAYQPFQLRG